jgi:diguanylate cyclase (GGDEF)-like protein
MDRRSLSRITRIVWPFASLWLLVAAAVVLFSGLEIRADRAAALAAARDETETFARAARAHLADTLANHDHALSLHKLVHERRLAPLPPGLPGASERTAAMPARRVDQYDREGRLAGTTDAGADPEPSVADRPWFDEARSRNAGELIIARPVGTARAGASSMALVKRLETADGAFDGVVASHIDPVQLLGMLGTLSVNDRMTLGIADRRGYAYAWTAGGPAGKVEGSLAIGSAMPPATGLVHETLLDGRPSLVARAEVPGRDLYVIAAVDQDAALEGHRRHARTTIVFAGLALTAISLTLAIVGRRAFAERDRRRQLERRYVQVRNRARTDPLTAVANRAAFDDQLRVAHAILAADGRPFVLAFIDIDRFKALNDRFGHATGDRALRRVARLLHHGVRREDTVARLGGDEFAVLMPAGNGLAMHRVFEPLRSRLNALVADEKWPIGFSIGVVAFESAPPHPREAVNVADRVMYDVKSHGRDGVRYAIYREGAIQPDPGLAQAVA